MFLYKLEIKLTGMNVCLIVLADSDEAAFGYAEGHLVRHFIKKPEVLETVIVEKKRVEKGSGYVIETGEF
ncbi:DUF3906 family protein [Paenibacillus mesotrionivorans]|uniref:DUF3906 family protein n=1 Tax=Paenibacillus mesotrionivorans TaxID=3160968 RepID=A0ACC7P391_9BACL